MKLSRYKQKHIFCIEGNWTNNLRDKATIETALDFLRANVDIDFIRKNCAGKEDFTTYLKISFERRYKKFRIIYLAFHGSPGKLHLRDRKNIDFNHIAEILNGEAQDKIIHFGSCSTLKLLGWDLRRFLKQTGALAISGYNYRKIHEIVLW